MTVYGCHNRAPLRDTAVVNDGPVDVMLMCGRNVRATLIKFIPDNMTKDCQYRHTDLGKADQKCEGCKWR